MNAIVSAAEANRMFSALLRNVRGGASYLVTSHGKPVARLVPASAGDTVVSAARETLFTRLEGVRVRKAARWTRDELYED
jgi:prevent-host-death family protein